MILRISYTLSRYEGSEDPQIHEITIILNILLCFGHWFHAGKIHQEAPLS
jgi:hypothetical protein